MSMVGNMSTTMRETEMKPINTISIAAMAMVYGRRSAIFTRFNILRRTPLPSRPPVRHVFFDPASFGARSAGELAESNFASVLDPAKSIHPNAALFSSKVFAITRRGARNINYA
jgi:hypothetical protein